MKQRQKLEVDTEELLEWCRSRDVPVNGNSRSSFAAEKVKKIQEGTVQ